MAEFLFHSERLGFRAWDMAEDIEALTTINQDKTVMEHFPSLQDRLQTEQFIARQKLLFSQKGYCFFSIEKKATSECIGFIGLSPVNFDSTFTPATEIGWRLGRSHWGKGYATEGALKCLEWGRKKGEEEIYSFTSLENQRSEHVMKKIGMTHIGFFDHPLLPLGHPLGRHTLYHIKL